MQAIHHVHPSFTTRAAGHLAPRTTMLRDSMSSWAAASLILPNNLLDFNHARSAADQVETVKGRETHLTIIEAYAIAGL